MGTRIVLRASDGAMVDLSSDDEQPDALIDKAYRLFRCVRDGMSYAPSDELVPHQCNGMVPVPTPLPRHYVDDGRPFEKSTFNVTRPPYVSRPPSDATAVFPQPNT